MSKRIWWTADEAASLIEHVAKMRLTDVASTLTELLQQAQDILPPSRRRKIQSHKAIRGFENSVRTKFIVLRKADAPEKVVHVPVEPNVKDVVQNADTDVLLSVLISRLVTNAEFMSTALARLSDLRQPERKPVFIDTSTGTQQKLNLPRIAIVGLLPDQFSAVENKVVGKAELIYIDKDQSSPKFPDRVQYVIVNRFTSHRWYDAAKQIFPGSSVIFSDGGITHVVKCIYDFCSKQVR